ncbi:hypothetical protein AA0114_g2773 [Alternaria tenuissima]|uniref:MalT-like TPR region domain-containing protein n=1 Tax=Alternaria tenuissima TaxID=119927 RepID=A0A4Q4MPK7_9PLEO|nr:hypothetical protein AA0114_g2773 [Alternaria tenuissima]
MAWASKYVVHHAECGDLETIDKLKNNEKLAKFSQGLVEVDLGLEDAAKLQLEGFFGVMLLCDPVAREAELRFQGSTSIGSGISIPERQGESSNFQLIKTLNQLYHADFRIRKNIRKVLEEHANQIMSQTGDLRESDLNICFQLAICYRIGFGGLADAQKLAPLLRKSGKTDQDLIKILDQLKSREANGNASTGVIYATLENMGNITYHDLISQYHACGILDDAEHDMMRDVGDLEASLGRRNAFWTLSATSLAEMYMMTGRTQDAEAWYISVMNVMNQEFGQGHEIAMMAAQNASSALFANGRLVEAAAIQIRVLETRQEKELQKKIQNAMNVGADGHTIYEMDDVSIETSEATEISPEAQIKIADLSGRITDALINGELERADALQYETWQLAKEAVGPDHKHSLSILHSLIDRSLGRREWDIAERLQNEEMVIMEKKFGPTHSRTLGRMSNLSETFARQGKWDEAQKLQEKCLATCVSCLGPQHKVTTAVMTNLTKTYRKQGLENEFLRIRRQLEDHHRREVETDHLMNRGISDIMALLASTYRAQGRFQDAERLLSDVLEERKKRLGIEHPDTVHTIAELSLTRVQCGEHT